MYVPATTFKTQDNINQIQECTAEHLMQLNGANNNYIIFSQSNTEFATTTDSKQSYSGQN